MVARKAYRRVVPPLILLMVFAMAPTTGQAQTTRAQVDRACADSEGQLRDYRAAQARFEESAMDYEAVLLEIDRLERLQSRIENTIENNADIYGNIQAQLERHAVEMYKRGGFNSTGTLLNASSVDSLLASSKFLASATSGGQRSLDDLRASRGELERYQTDLASTRVELADAEEEANEIMASMESAMEAEQAAYSKLSTRCRELNAKYLQEQAEAAARARQRAQGSIQVGSFICPFTQGRTHFINSWGFPRSGGRTHKGTDMHAAWNEPMYAVASGRVLLTSSALGGRSIWLTADNGVAYYYAHLNGYNVSNGQRVTQGQTIGFNGDSGNAKGGAPHLHFQIHPGGRSSAAANPYPTLAGVCFR